MSPKGDQDVSSAPMESMPHKSSTGSTTTTTTATPLKTIPQTPNEILYKKTGDLINHHMDSRRWDRVPLRATDIIIGSYAKSGTTWLQQIIRLLLPNLPSLEEEPNVHHLQPWIDFRPFPLDPTLTMLEKQNFRRGMKHHLPAHTLDIYKQPCYIYIVRDGRDVILSAINHHKSQVPSFYPLINSGEFNGKKYPVFEEDGLNENQYFKRWLENDGYPWWSYWEGIKSWWDIRGTENVLFCHYGNMKMDFEKEIKRIQNFLRRFGEVKEGEEVVKEVLEKAGFEYMKKNAKSLLKGSEKIWKNGGADFINKGVNGRWKKVLDEELCREYEKVAEEKLGKDCAEFMKSGVDPTGIIQ